MKDTNEKTLSEIQRLAELDRRKKLFTFQWKFSLLVKYECLHNRKSLLKDSPNNTHWHSDDVQTMQHFTSHSTTLKRPMLIIIGMNFQFVSTE